MINMNFPEENDQEAETNRVFEYYKKYSLNPELAKYFTGPDAEIVKRVTSFKDNKSNVKNNPMVSTPLEIKVICVDDPITSTSNQDENKNISPTSSIASNKKLEWDSGADIGYNNSYKLSAKKSASFPSLFSNDLTVKNSKIGEDKSVSETVKELRNMYHQLTFSSETSTSPTKENTLSSSAVSSKEPSPPKTSSTESEIVQNKSTSRSSNNSDNHLPSLQKKIGVPVANSTPNDDSSSKSSEPKYYIETPILRHQNKPKRNIDEIINICETEGTTSLEIEDHLKDKKSSNIQTIITENQSEKNSVENNSQNIKKIGRYLKEINLCVTKPISVECATMYSKSNANKVSQTTLSPKKISKSIQANTITEKKVIHSNPVEKFTPHSQKIEYITYKSDNSDLKSMVNNTESSSENKQHERCQHVEYKKCMCYSLQENEAPKLRRSKSIKKSDNNEIIITEGEGRINTKTLAENNHKSLQKEFESECAEPVKGKLLSRNKKTNVSSSTESSDTSNLKNKTDEQIALDYAIESNSEEMILAEMISLNHSRDLNTDIKRSIDILQKLLKSKKYDHMTKKYYIKKIVQKIVESKYSEDSTTSSELFKPTRKAGTSQIEPTVNSPINELKMNPSKAKLMDNIPWYPIVQDKYRSQTKKSKKLDCKTTKSEVFHPKNMENSPKHITKDDQNICVKCCHGKREQLLDFVPSSDQDRGSKQLSYENNIVLSSSPQDIQSSDGFLYTKCKRVESEPTVASTKVENKNWKSAKTLSERILENRDKIGLKIGQGDYLLHVAKNERQHQLSWIKNEIEHLVKLKEMLEKKAKGESQVASVMSSLLKMKVDDMKGLSKNFEVFVCKCSTTKCGATECYPKIPCPRGRNRKRRSASLTPGYYTIQTQLDPDGNLVDLSVFDEKGSKKYNYRDDGTVDDVIVNSKDHNTEVKLKPKTDVCGSSNDLYQLCKDCGKLYMQDMNKSTICVCDECHETNQQTAIAPDLQNLNICTTCGRLFVPMEGNPEICICGACYAKNLQSEQAIKRTSTENLNICTTCGRLFVPMKGNPEICICGACYVKNLQSEQAIKQTSTAFFKRCVPCGRLFRPPPDHPDRISCDNCCKRPSQKDSQQQSSNSGVKRCRICLNYFVPSIDDPEQSFCKGCLAQASQSASKCGCRVTFSDPLEVDLCEFKTCPKKAISIAEQNTMMGGKKCSICPRTTEISREASPIFNSYAKSNIFCYTCGKRGGKGCDCASPFFPKKPKLVGKGQYDNAEDIVCRRKCCACKTKIQSVGDDDSSSGNNLSPPEFDTSIMRGRNRRSSVDSTQSNQQKKGTSSTDTNGDELVLPKLRCLCKKDITTRTFADADEVCTCHKKSTDFSPTRSSRENSNASVGDNYSFVDKLVDKLVGSPCAHCMGTQDNLQSSSGSIISYPEESSSSVEYAKPKYKCLCKNSGTQYIPCPEFSSEKMRRLSKKSLRKSSEAVAKIDACTECARGTHVSRKKMFSNCPLEIRGGKISPSQSGKSCQCCVCSNCAVQTKELGRKNARCQCCICENCAVQVAVGKSDSSKRSILSVQRSIAEGTKTISPSKSDSSRRSRQSVQRSIVEGSKTISHSKTDFGGSPMSRKSNSSSTNKQIPSREMLPRDTGEEKHIFGEETPTVVALKDMSIYGEERPNTSETLLVDQRQQEQLEYESEQREFEQREYAQSEREQRELEQRQREQWEQASEQRKRESIEQEYDPREQWDADQREQEQLKREYQERQQQERQQKEKLLCLCNMSTCMCTETATHEEKNIQFPAYQQGISQTEDKGDAKVQCTCTEDVGTLCNCGLPECTCAKQNSRRQGDARRQDDARRLDDARRQDDAQRQDDLCQCTSSATNSTSSTFKSSSGSSQSYMSCICCKKEKMFKSLTNKLALCSPCQKVNQKSFYPYNYSNPLHSCVCYSLVDHNLLCQLKDTLTELERLEIYQQYSKILQNCKSCRKCGCKCKIPKKNKKGVAYFLKLENGCPNTHCSEYGEDQSEFSTQYGEDQDARSLPEVTVKVPNCKGSCAMMRDGKKGGNKRNKSCPSIQTYLWTRKPDFIYRAERRRKILRKAVLEREEDVEDRKIKFAERMNCLNHMENMNIYYEKNSRGSYGNPNNAYFVPDLSFSNPSKIVKPRVFKSFKEMKELTRKRYLHLPEVKNKKNNYKEMRLREANRLLANTFTKRLQRSTLRGNVDIPSNLRVISY